jgi:hypothetical protein
MLKGVQSGCQCTDNLPLHRAMFQALLWFQMRHSLAHLITAAGIFFNKTHYFLQRLIRFGEILTPSLDHYGHEYKSTSYYRNYVQTMGLKSTHLGLFTFNFTSNSQYLTTLLSHLDPPPPTHTHPPK